MQVIVTDVDMAGRVDPGQDVRKILQNMEKAQLSFSYTWFDAEGKLLAEDEVKLLTRNLHAISRQSEKYTSSRFAYETVMFDRWLFKLAGD